MTHETPPAGRRAAGELVHLRGSRQYRIAAGQTDVRGWSVWDADGRRVGRVVDLVVDTALLRAQYAEVRLDGAGFGARAARLESIAEARLDRARRALILRRRADADAARSPAHGAAGWPRTLGAAVACTGVVHVRGPDAAAPRRARRSPGR